MTHPLFTKEISSGKAIVRALLVIGGLILVGKLGSATAAKQKSGVPAVSE